MVASNNNHFFSEGATYYHSIRLLQEDYFKDYSDVRKKRFLARKLQIEEKVFFYFLVCMILHHKSYCNKELKSMIKMKQMELSTIIKHEYIKG